MILKLRTKNSYHTQNSMDKNKLALMGVVFFNLTAPWMIQIPQDKYITFQ